jgi:DNA-binding response OmpR family regulator
MRIGLFAHEFAERALVMQVLDKSGFEGIACDDAASIEVRTPRRRIDALVLDWKPDDRACRDCIGSARSETARIPVLLMVASGHEDDIIAGLSAGADDYLIKPLRPSELIARLQALLRRAYPHEALERYEFEPFRFHPEPCEVTCGEPPARRVTLTQKEFDLGLLLFRNAGRPLSRSHIRETVWGGDADVSSRTMDTHVSRLRSKLELGPASGYRVLPVYGYGYRLDRIESQTTPGS